jgi:cytochrome c oxidase cbb3-type subunit 3
MSENENKGPQFHVYDDIVEHDNPLPNWWLVTFYGTIIFAFLYYIHYTFGGGPTLQQELVEKMKTIPTQSASSFNEGDLEKKFAAIASLDQGSVIFTAKCAACHGQKGEGLIGPNLTDKFWIHGGMRADIVKVINEGVLDKGMPAWAASLKEEEIFAVSKFIFEMRNSPIKGKEPQGVEIN